MSFTLSRPGPVAVRTNRPSAGRRPVAVRAQFLEDVGAGFARIFTPRGKDAPTTGAPYSGKSRSHSAHKPASDVPYSPVQASAAGTDGAEVAQQRPDDDRGLGYIGKAAQQVVTGNFKSEDEPNAWSGEGKEDSSGWGGEIRSRHREGFHNIKAEVQAPRKAKAAPDAGSAAVDKEEEESSDPVGNIVSFLGKAAQRLVAHNFTGDKTEPEQWKDKEQASTGWKGDIHTRKREGFHSIKD